MLEAVRVLVDDILQSRQRMIGTVEHLSSEQGSYKLAPDCWSVVEVIEHLVLAEQGGLNKMWVALDAARRGKPVWTDPHPNRGAPIEDIIAKTWRDKEAAPPIATPSWGGPLAYWLSYFRSCQRVLEDFADEVREDNELETVIYPHYLSGPLNLRQRLEFLRFHMVRHQAQVEQIKRDGGFPQR